ncbi:hypothetical protein Tco_1476102 [Tanacetum coccineum]
MLCPLILGMLFERLRYTFKRMGIWLCGGLCSITLPNHIPSSSEQLDHVDDLVDVQHRGLRKKLLTNCEFCSPDDISCGFCMLVEFKRISLTGFRSCTSRSRYRSVSKQTTRTSLIHIESHHRFFPVDTSLIHIESRKSPTKSLFDVGSRRISIFTVNTKEYHSDVLAIITRIMRRT